jgi:predicted Zn finger-like uncharacterized protein
MILTCPSCGTQYAVKDGVIPQGGRKVRCASCGHSWHQDSAPEPLRDSPQQPVPGPDGASASQEPSGPVPPPPGDPAPDSIPPGEPRDFGFDITSPDPNLVDPPGSVPVPPPQDWLEQRGDEQDWDPEKELPDAEELTAVRSETRSDRKHNWLMGLAIAIGFVVLIALALWFVAPDSLRMQAGFAAAQPTPLQIAPGTTERQRLQSGNELVVVSGRIINPSTEPQQVPPIEAQLHDGEGRLIHSWTIAPPARTLPPGGSATFNSAEMEFPPSGPDATVTLSLRS